MKMINTIINFYRFHLHLKDAINLKLCISTNLNYTVSTGYTCVSIWMAKRLPVVRGSLMLSIQRQSCHVDAAMFFSCRHHVVRCTASIVIKLPARVIKKSFLLEEMVVENIGLE